METHRPQAPAPVHLDALLLDQAPEFGQSSPSGRPRSCPPHRACRTPGGGRSPTPRARRCRSRGLGKRLARGRAYFSSRISKKMTGRLRRSRVLAPAMTLDSAPSTSTFITSTRSPSGPAKTSSSVTTATSMMASCAGAEIGVKRATRLQEAVVDAVLGDVEMGRPRGVGGGGVVVADSVGVGPELEVGRQPFAAGRVGLEGVNDCALEPARASRV